jgi:hypothetical protein
VARVLVVEDDRVLGGLLQAALEAEGYEVVVSRSEELPFPGQTFHAVVVDVARAGADPAALVRRLFVLYGSPVVPVRLARPWQGERGPSSPHGLEGLLARLRSVAAPRRSHPPNGTRG